MRRARFGLFAALACLVLGALAGEAEAKDVYVAYLGSDSNPCTRDKPCASLQRAVNVAASGDRIVILDSGAYDLQAPLDIGKSVTITGEGVSATLVTAGTTPAIIVNTNFTKVILKDLTISGGGVGTNGFIVGRTDSVTLEGCKIENFTGDGIKIEPEASDSRIVVSKTIMRDNLGAAIRAFVGGAPVQLDVDTVVIRNNGLGILANGAVTLTATGSSIYGSMIGPGVSLFGVATATFKETIVANNKSYGFYLAGSNNKLTLESSQASGNTQAGLGLFSGNTAVISNSVLTNNLYGIYNFGGGVVRTRGTTTIAGNTNEDVHSTLTLEPGK